MSTGGFGNVPILHNDFVKSGLVTNEQFAECLAIGQISPGPNGLWVICLGYIYGGPVDAALALLAVSLPPLLVLLIRRLYERHRGNRAVEGFMMGLEVAVIAIFLSVMIDLLTQAPRTVLTFLLAAASLGLALTNRVPVAILIGTAALLGYLFR